MVDLRCVRCGKVVGSGYLCDACQYAMVSQPQPQGGPLNVAPTTSPVRKVDPFAIVAVVAVLIVGAIGIFTLPKLRSSSSEPKVAKQVDTSDPDDGPAASSFQPMNAQAPGRPPQAPTTIPSQVNNSSSQPQQSAQPMSGYEKMIAVRQTNESEAQQTLSTFLTDYCSERSAKIKKPVKVTTVTWWPNGSGMIAELDEGDDYRQGTAQFAHKGGWVWINRPDSEPATSPAKKPKA